MKKLISILILLVLSSAIRAGTLCDAACTLTITFPEGGKLIATNAVTITFGNNGLVDTGASTTAYVDGITLVLMAGEELVFGNNASFDIGDGGNIDYSDFQIESTGVITMAVSGGNEIINLSGMVFSVETLIINSNVVVTGGLTIAGNLLIGGSGTLTNTGTINITSGTVTLITSVDVSAGTVTTSAGGDIEVSGAGALTVQGGDIVVDSTLSITDTNELVVNTSSSKSSSGAVNGAMIVMVSVLVIGFRRKAVSR